MKKFLAVMLLALAMMPAMVSAGEWTKYQTQGFSRYLNSEIEVSPWADALMMRGVLVQGDHQFSVEATLEPEGANRFRGAGRIAVRFENNRACYHRFGLEMRIFDGKIYLLENTPRFIPVNSCEAAGPYEWYHYPEPYIAQ
jgi:hypothetical protein